MTMPVHETLDVRRFEFGLGARLAVIAAVLVGEAVLHTSAYQWSVPYVQAPFGPAPLYVAHALFRFFIAYAVFCVMLLALKRRDGAPLIGGEGGSWPIRVGAIALHILLLTVLVVFSWLLHRTAPGMRYDAFMLVWLAFGLGAATALFSAFAPLPVWFAEMRRHQAVLLYAIAPAIATLVAIELSQALWHPTAKITFSVVVWLLRPFARHLYENYSTLAIGTDHFTVIVSDICSGLEGMGLMLVFSISWLWYFRREYYFPRAFLIIPAALVLMFLLNAVRIAALVLIGDAGYPNVASIGFHSQAGWIAFNAVAFGVAVVSKHTPWLNRTARQANTIDTDNPTAVYLLPLLAILAAGMLAHALSAGFDFLYPLRLVAAVAVLWAYRRHYRQMDWRFSWRAIAVGSVIFVLWAAFDHWHGAAKGMPAPLAQLSDPWRGFWMVCRAAAAVITVPIAEELAYRGYLMRIFASRNFEAVALRDVHWPALAAAAVIFGVTHGSMMIPGMLAGAAYGLLAIKTNRLGEAIGAHATTNALIAIAVLGFDQWQLW
jgi:exosortase E/protease (VPEID-CTERM system)